MTTHHRIHLNTPAAASSKMTAEILAAYDAVEAHAKRRVVCGVLTAADKHGLRRRVAATTGASVEQVSDALAKRELARRPRLPITRGIE